MALGGFLAVTARPVQLAESVNSEAVDGDCSSTVVLDSFVLSSGCASTSD
jgi:hypothetical protein